MTSISQTKEQKILTNYNNIMKGFNSHTLSQQYCNPAGMFKKHSLYESSANVNSHLSTGRNVNLKK